MTRVHLDRLRVDGAAAGLACDGCTACCTVLVVAELRKPARRACDHVGRDGCRAHATRPESCRAFHCAWLRGVIVGDDARPDALGVMVDAFVERPSGATRVVAFELWEGALDAPDARALIDALAAHHEVRVSRRDGTWQTVGDARAGE